MDSSLESTQVAQKHWSYIGLMSITQWSYIGPKCFEMIIDRYWQRHADLSMVEMLNFTFIHISTIFALILSLMKLPLKLNLNLTLIDFQRYIANVYLNL